VPPPPAARLPGQPAIELALGIADGQRLEVGGFHPGFRTRLAGPPLIDPKILHDPIHPAVEPGARLELVEPPQRPLARALHEINRHSSSDPVRP